MTDALLRRRWFQFSLATMFVVAVLSTLGWLGRHIRDAHERSAMRHWLETHGGYCGELPIWSMPPCAVKDRSAVYQRSLIREVIGDLPPDFIVLPYDAPDDISKRCLELFPEAFHCKWNQAVPLRIGPKPANFPF